MIKEFEDKLIAEWYGYCQELIPHRIKTLVDDFRSENALPIEFKANIRIGESIAVECS